MVMLSERRYEGFCNVGTEVTGFKVWGLNTLQVSSADTLLSSIFSHPVYYY